MAMVSMTMTDKSRVARNTDPELNECIRAKTDQSIEYHAHHPEKIAQRLVDLEEEWDIERVLMTQASSLMLASTVFSILFSKKWLMFSALVSGFLLNHAVNGWCPPVPIMRKFGIRTREEILREYIALRAMQGEFDKLADAKSESLDERLKVVQTLF